MFIIKLITLLFLFLCFISGIISFYKFFLLYYKYKLNEIKNYLYFLSTITFIIIIIALNFFYKSIFFLLNTKIYNFFFFNSLLIGVCLYIYTFPLFIYSILRKIILKKILFLISLIPLIFNIILNVLRIYIRFEFNVTKISLYLGECILIFFVIYIFFYLLFNYKNITGYLRRKILKVIVIFILLYYPLELLDSFYDLFYFIFKYLPDGFSFTLPHYFLWNIVSVNFSKKYFC
jgi:hypothetical protein